MKVISVPYFRCEYIFELSIVDCLPYLNEHLLDSARERMLLFVEVQGILRYFGREHNAGLSMDIVSVESEAKRVVDGQDVVFVVLAPVFDPSDVGGRLVLHLEAFVIHFRVS